jgi:hypothetical protein
MKLPDNAVLVLAASLLLLSIASAYALHAYASAATLTGSSALLFFISSRKQTGRITKIGGYSCAFACLVLLAGLVSGGIGTKPCPDLVANPDSETKISYFYSPFCPLCIAQDSEIEAFLSGGADASVYWYDIRYCHAEAERYNFTGMPCFAVERDERLEKTCGVTSKEELSEIAGRLQ